jgi:hypothetical protein
MTLTVRNCLNINVTPVGGSSNTSYLIKKSLTYMSTISTIDMLIPAYTIETEAHQKACQLTYAVSITAGDTAKYTALLDTTTPAASWKLFNLPADTLPSAPTKIKFDLFDALYSTNGCVNCDVGLTYTITLTVTYG